MRLMACVTSRTLFTAILVAGVLAIDDIEASPPSDRVTINGVELQIEHYSASGDANELASRWVSERMSVVDGRIERLTDGYRVVLSYLERGTFHTVTFKPGAQPGRTDVIVAGQSLPLTGQSTSRVLSMNDKALNFAARLPFVPPASFVTIRAIEWSADRSEPRMFHLGSSLPPADAEPQLLDSLRRAGWQIQSAPNLRDGSPRVQGAWIWASRGLSTLTAALVPRESRGSSVVIHVESHHAP